ncbi:hypothetical protein [Paraurantiacibacter namhicola]|uniref:Glycerophosphoryl diester phosphodiesterase membrane domain-containing protein n=1 Tax=Paraurantiacibacter namhicola TaxID=645517 RepID=A0A1C7D9N6_9SPHN|nr:hypothetical protein [Paraurantiacibacter namhicola]ANU08209.1 hypothetical protein A6F65_01916 [Paraurantiacibacter namhicola]
MSENAPSVGDMMKAAFAVIARHPVAFAAYLAFVLLLGNIGLFTQALDEPYLFMFLPTLLCWLAQFLLFSHLLNGPIRDGLPWRLLPSFVGQAVMVSLAISMAMQIFIVPALLLGARWIAAPSFLMRAEEGAVRSLSLSWQATSGLTMRTTTALFVMVLVSFVLVTVATTISSALGLYEQGIFALLQLVFVGPLALSVALYGLLDRDYDALTDVFA